MSKAFVARLLGVVFVVSGLVCFMPGRVASLSPVLSRERVSLSALIITVAVCVLAWLTVSWRDAETWRSGWPSRRKPLYLLAMACGVVIMWIGDSETALLGAGAGLVIGGCWLVVASALGLALFFPPRKVRTA